MSDRRLAIIEGGVIGFIFAVAAYLVSRVTELSFTECLAVVILGNTCIILVRMQGGSVEGKQ